MANGNRSVLRLPNCEPVENQPSYSDLTSNVRVDPEAVHPGADPQLNWAPAVALNMRTISVMERDVEDDVIRSAKPPCEVVRAGWITGGVGATVNELEFGVDANVFATGPICAVPVKEKDPATVPV